MRVYKPGRAPASAPRRYPRDRARDIAIEKSWGAYFRLECGHMTSRAEQEIWEAWRPKRGKWYCETCDKWRDIAPNPRPPEVPQEPLF